MQKQLKMPDPDRMLVFQGKVGDRQFHARTLEEIGKACLVEIEDRVRWGYIVNPAESRPPKGSTDEIAQLDQEYHDSLNEGVRDVLRSQRDEMRAAHQEWANTHVEWQMVLKAREGNWEVAFGLIDRRQRGEYEGYEFVVLEIARPEVLVAE